MAKNDIEPRSVTVVGERSRTEPYELPAGWKWCRLGDVADWGSGGTPSRKNPEYYNGSIPWIKTGELNESYIFDSEEKISEEAINHSSAKLFPKETVVLAMYGATIGKTAIFGIDASTNQACACAICHKDLDNHYLFNFLKSKKDYFIYNAKGGAQPNISQEIIKNTFIPLPPTLAEQQRIVSRIESLFTKLDEAKDRAQSVLDGFKLRCAAVLHKAFTGELTAKWRKENGVSDDSWEEKTIGECLITISDKYDPEKDKIEGIQYIGLENIEANGGIISTGDASSVKSIKTLFKSNDLLYGKLRPYLDKHDISDFDGICSTDILVYRSKIGYEIKFFNYLFSQKRFIQYAVENSKGINLPRTSEKSISAYSQKIPTLAEQQEIVRILDTVLEKESRAKEAAQNVLDQIALLKKSILARAFRGEL